MPSSGLGVDERGALGEPGGGKDDAEGGEDDPIGRYALCN